MQNYAMWIDTFSFESWLLTQNVTNNIFILQIEKLCSPMFNMHIVSKYSLNFNSDVLINEKRVSNYIINHNKPRKIKK